MQPLSGIKVLDFTTLLPGPMVTMYLADWGADVIRVEAPDREDMSRLTPPFAQGTSTTHAFLNRSKKSVVIDLKDPSSRASLQRLVQESDVVIEQFRPGVMAKLGLDYPSLAKLQPRLIYCSLTGYGQTGPYRDKAGHDINYAALAGLAALTGTKAAGPVLHGAPVCDLAGSYHALFGIMTALFHRERSGEGQYIDVSITDSALMLSGMAAQMGLAAKVYPTWEGTLLNGGSFYGYYKTKDGQYLSVGGLEPKFYKGFLEAIGGLGILALDQRKVDAVKQAIQAKLETKSAAEWLELFKPLDVCVELVLGFDDIEQHPQFIARGMFVDVPMDGGSQKQLASPLRFSTFRPVYRHAGSNKGANDALLK
ncbi:MAG: CaiB/BaiF CoA-transferase family protein [Proteobacteria bacterium]|nr:CaiB/BaiF CoA-transferase family protein [Pseudomonadota bacterium]